MLAIRPTKPQEPGQIQAAVDIFERYEAVEITACEAWNSLIDNPDRITSIRTRQWQIIAPG